jgi:hypothetical protein
VEATLGCRARVHIPVRGRLRPAGDEPLTGTSRAFRKHQHGLGTAFRRSYYRVLPSTVRFTEEGIEFDTTNTHGKPAGHFALTFADVRAAKIDSVTCKKGRRCDLVAAGGNKLPHTVPRLLWNDTGYSCTPACEQQAASFVAALNRLVALAGIS